MSLYSCTFRQGRVTFCRQFVGADIDEIENQAALYAQCHGAEYLSAEWVTDVEVAA